MVYLGSKNKYCKEIIPILNKIIKKYNIDTFVDVCCGGCNITDKISGVRRIAIDINPYLIALYEYAIYGGTFPQTITREDWDSCKLHPEQNPDWFVGLTAYFASYSARGFCGGYCLNSDRDYYSERLRNFQKQIPKLKDVNFRVDNVFNLNTIDFTSNTLIYIDPPYYNTKKYDYSKGFNYEKFWDKVRELSKQYMVVVSEQIAPPDFCTIWSKDVTRNNFGGSGKVKGKECLFWYEHLMLKDLQSGLAKLLSAEQ